MAAVVSVAPTPALIPAGTVVGGILVHHVDRATSDRVVLVLLVAGAALLSLGRGVDGRRPGPQG